MKYRQLGKNGPTVSAIGYGAMVLSPGIYNPVEEEESLATIERVFDLGINFVDTADIYGQGHNERLIGGAIRGLKSRAHVATQIARGLSCRRLNFRCHILREFCVTESRQRKIIFFKVRFSRFSTLTD